MSETLPTMIAWNHLPTIYTYQESRLHHDDHKESKVEKGINLFNELKALNVKPSDRTYAALRKMRNILKMSDCLLQLP
ncbi:hypothetical protein IGI04_009522 [Brassica rapa subsp. trilocularis]|uniref:Uncharacterized protein n=1 Tax=Brassica rapa subsp. trilocularis TaxID=1813537 RepID=A0ABQ7MXK0_BRACM|nr:hypothetical protein IGI04_009522 [Brassica rapa subsp. trilocularis]